MSRRLQMFGQFDLALIELAYSPALMTLMYTTFNWIVPIISAHFSCLSCLRCIYAHHDDANGVTTRVVMNLLIALMVSGILFLFTTLVGLLTCRSPQGGSYERVEESAANEGARKRAELIHTAEAMLTEEDQENPLFFPKWLHFFHPQDGEGSN